MIDELMKMKSKSKGKMDPKMKDAKLSVLKHIKDMAEGDMGEEVKGLKKVTVAAPDKSGLEEGLETAKEMVGEKESDPNEGAESPIQEKSLEACMEEVKSEPTVEAIDELMAALEKKKAELESE